MKKFILTMSFAVLMFGFVHNPAAAPFESQTETQVTGTLDHVVTVIAGNSETEYRLKLDKSIIFSKGSKSERTVSAMKLDVPDGLQQKVLKLEGKHVAVQGTMTCEMLFSPWTAECDLLVRQIEPADNK